MNLFSLSWIYRQQFMTMLEIEGKQKKNHVNYIQKHFGEG